MNEHRKSRTDWGIYREIMESLPVAIYDAFAPENDKAVYFSQQLADFFGLNALQRHSFNETLFALLHPEDREEVKNKWQQASIEKTGYVIECRIKRATDADYFWILLEGKFTYDENDKPMRHTGLILNVDECCRRERQLRESEERYRKIAETMSDYVYSVQVKDGRAVATIHGGACQPITGYTPADFVHNPNLWIEMVHELDRPLVLDRAQKMLRGEVAEQIEHRIMHRNGKIRWVHSTVVPHRDERGEIVFFDGIVRDITKQKKEAEIQQQHQYLNEILLNLVPFASVLLQEDGEIITANKQGINMGFEPNKSWCSVWQEMYGDRECSTMINAAILSGERRQVEVTYQGRHYETTFVPLEPDLCLACFYDITKRKVFEQALQHSKLLNASILQSDYQYVLLTTIDGRIEMVNEMTEKLWGRKAETLKGKNLTDAYPGEHTQMLREKIRRVFKTRTRVSYNDFFQQHYLEVNALPVWNDDGEIFQVLFVARDYSEQKRTEMNLLEAYQTLTALVECSPNAIVTFNAQHVVKSWNPAGKKLFGWTSVDVCGKPLTLFGENLPPAIATARENLLRGKTINQIPATVHCKNGRSCQAAVTGTALLNAEGEIDGYVLVIEKA